MSRRSARIESKMDPASTGLEANVVTGRAPDLHKDSTNDSRITDSTLHPIASKKRKSVNDTSAPHNSGKKVKHIKGRRGKLHQLPYVHARRLTCRAPLTDHLVTSREMPLDILYEVLIVFCSRFALRLILVLLDI